MTEIYLVRHCEAEGNVKRIFQGQTNTDISEKGAKQLEFLADRFEKVRLDKIYATSLLRAQKTARAVAERKGMQVLCNDDFIEIGLGELDGKSFDYIFETHPDLKHAWYKEPHKFASPGGESMTQVYARAKKGLEKLISDPDNKDKAIMVVTHGCLLRNLMCAVLFDDITRLAEVQGEANTGVTLLLCDEKGIRVQYACDASHLPEEYASSIKNVYTQD